LASIAIAVNPSIGCRSMINASFRITDTTLPASVMSNVCHWPGALLALITGAMRP
jgi:hypothetical protein